jgi:cytochrome c556
MASIPTQNRGIAVMKKSVVVGLLVTVLGATAAFAGAIEDRQDLMKQNGGTGRILGGMARDPSTFDAAAAKVQLQILVDNSAKIPGLFPVGSDTGATKTQALPTVWSDTAGFKAAAAKLGTDAKAAMAATDGASFAAAYKTVQGDCNACHMTYRAPQAPRAPAPAP